MSGKVRYADEGNCTRTFATLRIYSGNISPQKITEQLGVTPSRIWNKGSTETVVPRKHNGWFVSSRGEIESTDTKRHVDYILQQLQGHEDYIATLTASGLQVDIMCLWHKGNAGEGGPNLLPEQMAKLGAMGIAIAWNIYTES